MKDEIIRAVVIDDEPLARGMMEGYVRNTPFLELSGSFPSAAEALEVLRSADVDVAFLDIQMPDLDGLELSRLVDTKIVFITAFDKYAVEGFKVGAADYLLKPVTYAAFLTAAGRVRERIELEKAAADGHNSLSVTERQEAIFIRSERRLVQVLYSSIEFIESDRDYIVIHTEDGSRLSSQMTLGTIEESLPPDKFLRVHRSFIVNLDKVRVIESNCILFGKVLIPVTEAYKDSFYRALSNRASFPSFSKSAKVQ